MSFFTTSRMCFRMSIYKVIIQLSATDLLTLASMKNAAKCDKQWELQNSVNHRIFERILRSLVFRGACLFECHLNFFQPRRLLEFGLDVGDSFFHASFPDPLKCISVI